MQSFPVGKFSCVGHLIIMAKLSTVIHMIATCYIRVIQQYPLLFTKPNFDFCTVLVPVFTAEMSATSRKNFWQSFFGVAAGLGLFLGSLFGHPDVSKN